MSTRCTIGSCRNCTRASLLALMLAGAAASLAGSDGPGPVPGGSRAEPERPPWRLPPGFEIEKVAGQPLVDYPMLGCFDDRGRLFVAEGTGTNLPGTELVKIKRGRIMMLEDTDGDGRFDKSTVFADQLVFPQGVLWHDGVLYAASHPSIWRFEDTDDDGRADRREVLCSDFGFNGNGCDIHGPFLGPDGRIYWTDGRHGYKIKTPEGPTLEGFASRIWRCRPGGREIERLCGGGFDNPVEIDFTPEGEMIGTMDQGEGDCLLHFVEGGVYPKEHDCTKEFPKTGPLLPPIVQFSAAVPVALCGMTRYRSPQFGPEYQDTFFTAQFNVHRVQQHVLVPDAATYRSIERDFLSTADPDAHPTDVIEDADGSLLVIDMGAWFNYGCPTSKIAKPEVKGTIWRVRRAGVPPVKDPWGTSLDLAAMKPAELVALLDDPRPKLRDRVIEHLIKRSPNAVPLLATTLQSGRVNIKGKPSSVEARRNAVWTLSRIATPQARQAVREATRDRDASVRHAAVRSVGVERDAEAVPDLKRLLAQEEPPLRLAAATALGRIGQREAVPALLDAMRPATSDRFLEHGLIYALLRIGDREALLPSLKDTSPRVRRAALIALDQSENGRLTRELVAPLLDTDDPELQQAALAVISRHAGWSGEIIGLLRDWLGGAALSARQESSLTGALLAFCGDEQIQQLAAATLADTDATVEKRLLLLRVMARCRLERLPPAWLDALARSLGDADLRVRSEAVATIRMRNLPVFDQQLVELSRQSMLPAGLRIAALGCVAPRQPRLDADAFALLVGHVNEETEPLVRVAAARTLGAARLDNDQLKELCGPVARSGPLLVPAILPAFARANNPEVGRAIVAALNDSPGSSALAADDVTAVLKGYPAEVAADARPLLAKLSARHEQQEAHLAQVTLELAGHPPNPDRGRQVFFSKKVGCYGCHRMDGQGGSAGPELSKIAQLRGSRDLLEAIVFPSASIAPDYRQYVIATTGGQVLTGMIAREDSDAVYLRTVELAEIRVARSDIEAMKESPQSIMPDGLERTMTQQELSDLLEFLFQRR